MNIKLTAPQLRTLRAIIAKDDDPWSEGVISRWKVRSVRLRQSLIDKGLVTDKYPFEYLRITDAGRTAVAYADSKGTK